MAKAPFSLTTMSVDALLKLRDDIGSMLSHKTQELKKQLHRIEAQTWVASASRTPRAKPHPRKGMKVPPKYRGPSGELWAGRGARPKWLEALLQQGRKVEEFLIAKPGKAAASRKKYAAKKSRRKRKQRAA